MEVTSPNIRYRTNIDMSLPYSVSGSSKKRKHSVTESRDKGVGSSLTGPGDLQVDGPPPAPALRGNLQGQQFGEHAGSFRCTHRRRIRHDVRHKRTRSAGLHRMTHVTGVSFGRSEFQDTSISQNRLSQRCTKLQPRTLVSGCQPYLANGTPRCLGLRFWARFFYLQGFTNEEKGVRLYLVQSRQTGRFTQKLTIRIEFTQPRWRCRGTSFTPRVFPTVW